MITLYASPSSTDRRIAIALEELGLEYRVCAVDAPDTASGDGWFQKLNPNGRQPVIVDHDNGDFPVFETGAALLYLADKTKRLIPANPADRLKAIQWLMLQLGTPEPQQEEASTMPSSHPLIMAPYVSNTVKPDVLRLFEVLDRRLSAMEHLAGEYSVADISTWSWLDSQGWRTMDDDDWPHLARWAGTIGERAAVKRACSVVGAGIKSATRSRAQREVAS